MAGALRDFFNLNKNKDSKEAYWTCPRCKTRNSLDTPFCLNCAEEEKKAETENEGEIEDVVSESGGGQWQHTKPADHQSVGERDQNLTQLPRGQGESECSGQTTFVDELAEHGLKSPA